MVHNNNSRHVVRSNLHLGKKYDMRIEFNERYARKNTNKATLSLHFVFKVPQAIQAHGTASHDNLSTASHEVVQLEQFAEESLDPNPLLNISWMGPEHLLLPSGHVIFHQSQHTRTDPRIFWPSGNMIVDATGMTLVPKIFRNISQKVPLKVY